jgi:hypothetical protein
MVHVRYFPIATTLRTLLGNDDLALFFTPWTPETGLLHSSVRGIVHTPDGYL